MCGLVGLMGFIGVREKKILSELLLVDSLRGEDSTGVAVIDHNLGVSVIKRASNPFDFFDSRKLEEEMRWCVRCIIGHNRKATQGSINNTNAHPFEFSSIVGAHNGTLRSYDSLDNPKDFEVDSECLLSHINARGIDDAFNKCSGAMALTWADVAKGELFFFRNSERPLSYCYSEDKRTIFWASESWMLSAILGRNGLKHTDIVKVTEDTIYKFKIPTGYQENLLPLSPPSVRKLERPKPVTTTKPSPTGLNLTAIKTGTGLRFYEGKDIEITVDRQSLDVNSMPFILCSYAFDISVDVRIYATIDSDLWKTLLSSTNSFMVKVKSAKSYAGESYLLADIRTVVELNSGSYNDDVPFDDDSLGSDGVTVEGFGGKKLTYNQFKKAAKHGCAWCTETADFGDEIMFIGESEFICKGCLTTPEVKEYLEDGVIAGGGMH